MLYKNVISLPYCTVFGMVLFFPTLYPYGLGAIGSGDYFTLHNYYKFKRFLKIKSTKAIGKISNLPISTKIYVAYAKLGIFNRKKKVKLLYLINFIPLNFNVYGYFRKELDC